MTTATPSRRNSLSENATDNETHQQAGARYGEAQSRVQAIRQCSGNDLSGIELAERIKKGQFKTGKLGESNATLTELWNAALAA